MRHIALVCLEPAPLILSLTIRNPLALLSLPWAVSPHTDLGHWGRVSSVPWQKQRLGWRLGWDFSVVLFCCCSHRSGEDAAPNTAVFLLGWAASGMGWAPVGALCTFLASTLTHPNKSIILTSLFEDEPRRTQLQVLDVLATLPAPSQCDTGTQHTGEREAGTMELMVGLHPTAWYLGDPAVRQIGTQDARV